MPIEDLKFKKTTDIEPVKNFLNTTQSSFGILMSSSTASTYKVENTFYDLGVKKSSILFLEGERLESYFSYSAKHQYNQIRLAELLSEGLLSNIGGKWLFIAGMNDSWRVKTVYYFCDKIKYAGCLGLVFDSDGINNFGQVLIEDTDLKAVQFPEQKYKKKRKQITDDGF